MEAAKAGNAGIVTLLLNAGAKKDIKNANGDTAADFCG